MHDNCSAEDDLEHSSQEDGDETDKTDYVVQDELQPETGNVPSVDVALDEISDECEDLDWCLKYEDTSGEDDEAEELSKHAKEVLRKIRMNLPLDEDKEVKESTTQIIPFDEMDEGNDTPNMDSTEEYSYDEDEHGNSVRMKSRFPRFDSKAAVPIFSLGMTFWGRIQFKRALVKY